LGYQSMVVSRKGSESTLENALSELSEFGIKRPRAVELIQIVARAVDGWAGHFARLGVCAADMEQLAASIDRESLRFQRGEFC
jgi:serine/threonine-protein kinase HipA